MKTNRVQDAVQYIGIGLQLAVTILLGLFSGYFIDRKFGTVPWFTLTGTALGLGIAFFNLITGFKNKNSDEIK